MNITSVFLRHPEAIAMLKNTKPLTSHKRKSASLGQHSGKHREQKQKEGGEKRFRAASRPINVSELERHK